MSMESKIKAEAQRDALEYRDIIVYLGERFNEDEEQTKERVEIVCELVRETPGAAGAAAEFLGLSPRQINLVLEVRGVKAPQWIAQIIADEVSMFDAAGEAIRAAIIAVSEVKGYNIAAARYALNAGLEDIHDGRKTLAEVAQSLGITQEVLIAYRDA